MCFWGQCLLLTGNINFFLSFHGHIASLLDPYVSSGSNKLSSSAASSCSYSHLMLAGHTKAVCPFLTKKQHPVQICLKKDLRRYYITSGLWTGISSPNSMYLLNIFHHQWYGEHAPGCRHFMDPPSMPLYPVRCLISMFTLTKFNSTSK